MAELHAQDATETLPTKLAFLAGGGELGARIRAFDWTQTPLGPPEHWPQSLKTAVRIMLTSRQPIWIGWGEELIYLYNDPYKSIIGGKHPAALGQPVSVVWQEIWSEIGPMLSTAMHGDVGTYVEEQLLLMERHGYPEETYYTFSYSPIPLDGEGEARAGGIICANTEDTKRVVGERELALLRELAAGTAEARTVEAACVLAVRVLAKNPRDLPFAMLYLADAEGDTMTLVGASGIASGHPAAPPQLALDDALWPLASALDRQEPQWVADPPVAAELPSGVWGRPPTRAVVLPVTTAIEIGRPAALVVGLNPYRVFDEGYRGFLELVAGHIAAALGNARAYEQERERAESLAELDRAKTAFFSNISHEFRTPLTLILGPIEELLGEAGRRPGGDVELLAAVHRNGLRLQKLVNTLLDFSRIEAGRVEACYEPTDLSALTAELASTFRSACERAGLSLEVACEPLPERVFVDVDMWEKVVLNLLSNAFKFTLEGGIRVEVRPHGGAVRLRVCDTGVGIPAEEMPNLFVRFHRVEGSGGRTMEGSGIGLALVSELVRLHGGKVWAESAAGRGTTFTVELPLGAGHLPSDRVKPADRGVASTAAAAASYVEEALRWIPAPAEARPAEPERDGESEFETSGGSSGGAGRALVLVADDNADMRDYLARLLRAHHDVIAVPDGREALRVAREATPQLVLTDVMMPGLDGLGLLQALRADPETQALPVILLSARAGEEARVEGLEAGADDYLTKPFAARELLARVEAHLALAKRRVEAVRRIRESERRFRHMADNSPVMIWVTDPSGRCTYLNELWYDFTGTESGQGLEYGWIDVLHPEDREGVRASFVAANARQEPWRCEYRVRRHDGEYAWAIDSAAPRFGDDGDFLGYVGSVVDVSDLKRVEGQLREADRRKDEFLATLAHELRNPLAPIRTGLELLRLGSHEGAMFERVRTMMERQTRQMVRLIDDLMDVSRITRGKLELRVAPVELGVVVHEAIEAVRASIEEAGHRLHVAVPGEPAIVVGDAYRLAQVLSNLLNNAVKYTPRGGEIWLSMEFEGRQVVLRVRDTGLGIPEGEREHIFQMFAQIERSFERGQAGLGIGLTIVRSLVEMHGGTIEVHSPGGRRGSEFVVRLPRSSERLAPAPAPDGASPGPTIRQRRRILVVDDNRDAADGVRAMLELLGHEVRTAYDGLQALQLGAAFRPELVLLDLGMPRLDGFETARRLRASAWGQGVTLVALTGWGQAEDRRRTAEAGFDHHMVKPVEPSALRALLRAADDG